MAGRKIYDWSEIEIRGFYARYLEGETVGEIGKTTRPPCSPAMIYYHFGRLGLPLHSGLTPARGKTEYDRKAIPVAAPKRLFAGPSIYRSEFIRGDAESKLRGSR